MGIRHQESAFFTLDLTIRKKNPGLSRNLRISFKRIGSSCCKQFSSGLIEILKQNNNINHHLLRALFYINIRLPWYHNWSWDQLCGWSWDVSMRVVLQSTNIFFDCLFVVTFINFLAQISKRLWQFVQASERILLIL